MMRGLLGTLALAAGLASWQAPGAPAGFADRTGPYLGWKAARTGPRPLSSLQASSAPAASSATWPSRRTDGEISSDLPALCRPITAHRGLHTRGRRALERARSRPRPRRSPDTCTSSLHSPRTATRCSSSPRGPIRPPRRSGRQSGHLDDGRARPAGWGPRVIVPPVNSALPGYFPSLTRDGTIYFTREEAGSRVSAIWRARRESGGYRDPERLPAQVNSGRSHFNAFVAPDQSYVIGLTDGRPDSIGGCDYYVVFRAPDDRWSQPINLGPEVNTKGSQEFSPFVSPDGRYFFFMSSRPAAPERLMFRLFRGLHAARKRQRGHLLGRRGPRHVTAREGGLRADRHDTRGRPRGRFRGGPCADRAGRRAGRGPRD